MSGIGSDGNLGLGSLLVDGLPGLAAMPGGVFEEGIMRYASILLSWGVVTLLATPAAQFIQQGF